MSRKRGQRAACAEGKGGSLSETLAKCDAVVSHLAPTVKHAILSRTMLDAADSDKRLLSAFQDTVEAQAFVVVRFSLM